MSLRLIESRDDAVVAAGIREVYAVYGCVGPGYSPNDPEMDCLTATYSRDGHAYFVAEHDGAVVGGCGYGPYGPEDAATCELQKLFVLPAARGTGLGETLMLQALEHARGRGYQQCYLETVAGMGEAIGLYRKHGFEELDAPLHGGGHHSCDRWFARMLQLLLVCVLVLAPACAGPTVPKATEPVSAPELRHELILMQLEAEAKREELIERGIVNLSLAEVYEQRRIYREHADRLKEILARRGWPTRSMVARDGLAAATQIAINADHDLRFQRECLELMDAAWRRGEGDGPGYAALTDWVRVAQGLPQVFGTQADFIDGQLQFHPIEDIGQVDARRAQVGLMSLAEYRAQLIDVYLIREP